MQFSAWPDAVPETQSTGSGLIIGVVGLCPALGFTVAGLVLGLIFSPFPKWEASLLALCCFELGQG